MKNKEENILGVIGNPLKQSMSPILHNYWLKKYNLEGSYCKFQLKNIDNIKTAVRALNIKGLNITIPYKKKIIKQIDKIDKIAKTLQAVNTINNRNGILEGYNTDVEGFILGTKKLSSINTQKPAIIIGAGGAAEAVVYGLRLIGNKKIFIMNRTKSKAQRIANKYQEVEVRKWMDYRHINNASIIVNTTSLGMIGYPSLPISLKNADKDTKVYDIVYNPLETKLIKEAKKRKLENVTGLYMFLGQAQKSFKIWFNINPNLDKYLVLKIKKKIQTL